MAHVFKRSGSPYWYARWQYRGKDFTVSTKKRSKPEAEAELKQLVAKAKGQLTIKDQLQTLLELIGSLPSDEQHRRRQELAQEILRDQDRKVAVAEGWPTWCDNSNREYDPKASTLSGYEAIWKRFAKWAASVHITFLHQLTREQAEEYAAHLWNSKVSASTYNQHIKFLRGAFTALERKAGLVGNV